MQVNAQINDKPVNSGELILFYLLSQRSQRLAIILQHTQISWVDRSGKAIPDL